MTPREKVLKFWHLGFDTAWIYSVTGVSEPDILEIITEERSARRGLPSPYDRPVRMSA